MARPKVPLISRRSVVVATLEILEHEGIDGLSVRRIARQLNVNAASLYHHFDSKDDILTAAARAALAEIQVDPFDPNDGSFVDWFAQVGLEHRRFLIARPYMIPLMVQRVVPHTTLAAGHTGNVQLGRYGIADADDRIRIQDTIEGFVVGSALMASSGADREPSKTDEGDELAFLTVVKAMIESLIAFYKPTRSTAKSTRS
ncbi:MAG TPA: helix-turn-helix domain-containing protein [Ilumatobacteraceae bacterium]|nr:helix-turn-helix domain-containing protein [Ilumatobacteraceae bacterium]